MEETLGKRIVSHRKRLGLTQDQLAERLGITAQAVSKWENDQSCPDITTLPELARIFGTTTDALLGIQPDPVPEPLPAPEEETQEPEAMPAQTATHSLRRRRVNRGRLELALVVLLVGGLLLAGSLLERNLNFWALLWPSILLVFGLSGLYPRFRFLRAVCALLGGYLLANQFGLLPPAGDMLLPVGLMLLGLALLASALCRKSRSTILFFHNPGRHGSLRTGAEDFVCEAAFTGDTCPINLPRLSRGSVECAFGDLTVDLSGCAEAAPDCRIRVECAFGNVTVLIPRRFRAEADSDTAFGQVDITGHPDPGAAPIRLHCDVSFGAVELRYI